MNTHLSKNISKDINSDPSPFIYTALACTRLLFKLFEQFLKSLQKWTEFWKTAPHFSFLKLRCFHRKLKYE